MHLRAGDIFDRYTIEGLLGLGGMGEVYRARDVKLERSVALKLLRVDLEEAADTRGRASARLLREARAAAALEHVNAVAIHDVGEVDGVPFIAMELVLGQPLRDYIGDDKVSLETRIRWLAEIGRALAVAHRHGLIHRDIKPENVMVRHDGVIKVLDFGIAHRQRLADMELPPATAQAAIPLPHSRLITTAPVTHDSAIMGTPRYMAPEQLRGDALDARSDQFAWGVVAYELLTGLPPWSGDDASLTLVSSMLNEDPPAAEPLLAAAPKSVALAVLRALHKEREGRFATMLDAVAAIELRGASVPPRSHRGETPPRRGDSHPPSPAGSPSVRTRTRRWTMGGAALVTVAIAAVPVLVSVIGSRSGRSAPTTAAMPTPMAAPTRLTDLPTPPSEVAEARAAYVAGMHALHDASIVPAMRHFIRATELDPSMAAARLRLITHGRSLSETDVPTHFAKAREMRSLLTPRDQALLWALEPGFLLSPPDEHEVTRRLVEIAARWPEDSELQYLAIGRADDPAQAREGYKHLLDKDPDFALALWRAANDPLTAGDYPRALELLDRCVAIAADSTACLTVRALVYEETGRCADMERDARLLEYVSPSARTHDLVARVLFANGAPTAAVREALERKWSASSGEERAAHQRDDESHLAVLAGDFPTAERLARESVSAVEHSASEDDHTNTVMPLIEIYREVDKTSEAARLAVHYLEARPSWQSGGAWAPLPDLFAVAEQGGLRTAEQRQAALSEWLRLWKEVDPLFQPQSWVLGYARPAVTPADAAVALALAPHPLPRVHMNQFHREGLGSVGKVLLLAGHPAEALPELRAAAATCSALQAPIEHTRAHFYLGEALEQTGDRPAACSEYGAVLSRWGSAKPRSVTADRARARRSALACP